MLPIVSRWQISSSDHAATVSILRKRQLFLIDWDRRPDCVRESVRVVEYTSEEYAFFAALDACIDRMGSTLLVSKLS